MKAVIFKLILKFKEEEMVEALDVGKKRKEFLEPLPGQALKQHEKLQKVLQDAKSAKQLGNLYDHI